MEGKEVMMLEVFTVYDKAVSAHLQPFFCRSRGEAVRSFSEACNDPKNNFYKYGQDYVLVHLGQYDDSSGLFVCGEPLRVISAVEVQVDPFTEDNRSESVQRNGRLPM